MSSDMFYFMNLQEPGNENSDTIHYNLHTHCKCTQSHSASALKRFNKSLTVFQIQCNTMSGFEKEHIDPVQLISHLTMPISFLQAKLHTCNT